MSSNDVFTQALAEQEKLLWADTIIFQDGRFRSTACDRYEYGDGAYTAAGSGQHHDN